MGRIGGIGGTGGPGGIHTPEDFDDSISLFPIENVGIPSVGPHQLKVMTIRFEISMPSVIRLGARIALEVQISLMPNTSRPPGTGEVKLSIFSPGFRLLSGHVRHVSLSLIKKQSKER